MPKSKMRQKATGSIKIKNNSSADASMARPDPLVVRVPKQRNIKNKNLEPSKKIDMRNVFIKKLVETNDLPPDVFPSVKDIESVLILNKLPKRATENRNLYKFFGKGASIRAPSKEVYLAMKRAVETNTLKTTKNEVARVVAAAEREKIHDEVNRLIQERDKRALEKQTANSSESANAAAKGMDKFTKKVNKPVFPTSGPFFNHGLKLHMASMFYDEILHYETDATDEDTNVRLEMQIEQEYGRLILLPGLVRAFSMKMENMRAPELIRATQKLLISYLKLDE